MQPNLFTPAHAPAVKQLRSYQQDCVESVFDFFAAHEGNPLCVIPTAGGKSLIIAEFIRQANVHFPGTRFIVLSHVSLLLTQNAEELMGQWPDASISFYSDSLSQKDLSGDIVFAGIQSIYKRAYDFRHSPDIIIVDEAHTLSPDSSAMYRKFLSDMLIINPHIKVVGFTATPFRASYGMLHKGKNALFTHIAYEIKIPELIKLGHLCPIITPQMTTKMDTVGVKMQGGDFVTSQLSKAVDKENVTKACVDEVVAHGAGRKKWIVFTVDIAHCEHVRDEIRSRGISCDMVHSKMDNMECNRVIDKFKNGDLRCLVNVAKLTTGANFPAIDMMVFMRPLRSPVLYVQCAGRGMRTSPHKRDCILLDFGGTVTALGPVDQVHVPEKGEGTGEAPIKYCPSVLENNAICNTTLPAAAMKCPSCGYDFPPHELNIDGTPSDAAVLSSQLKPKIVKVSRVAYYRHKKEGKPDTMRVDYLCGFETYREWLHFERFGYAREKACQWWRGRANTVPPNTIDEALRRTGELTIPLYIHVKKIGKYHEIVGYDFTEPEIER